MACQSLERVVQGLGECPHAQSGCVQALRARMPSSAQHGRAAASEVPATWRRHSTSLVKLAPVSHVERLRTLLKARRHPPDPDVACKQASRLPRGSCHFP
eukprot:347383-Chlamydomonas_euryale.AAC.1